MSGALPLEIGNFADGEEASLLSPSDVAFCYLGLQCVKDPGEGTSMDKITTLSYSIVEFMRGKGSCFDLGLEAIAANLQVRQKY